MPNYALDPFGRQVDLDSFTRYPGRYIGDFTVLNGTTKNNQPITLQGHEQYFAVLRLYVFATNVFRVKLYQSIAGLSLTMPSAGVSGGTSDQARSDLLYGTAGRPAVLPAYWLIPGSGQI